MFDVVFLNKANLQRVKVFKHVHKLHVYTL